MKEEIIDNLIQKEPKSSAKKNNKISIRVDDEMLEFLEQMSKRYNLTKSEVLRIIIAGRIDRFTDCTRYVDKSAEDQIKAAIYSASNELTEYKNAVQNVEYQIRKIGTNYNQEIKFMDEFTDKDHLPVLPRNAVESLVFEAKNITADCNKSIEAVAEVLTCLLPT